MACTSATSVAKLFLQLTARRASPPLLSSSTSTISLLDILLPPPAATRCFSSRSASPIATATVASLTTAAATTLTTRQRPHCRQDAKQNQNSGAQSRPRARAPAHNRTRVAAFSTTPPRRQTMTLYNPQKDEDGNEMRLEITPRAAKRLSDIMAKDANPNLALRIQVESGGCHGFQYVMRLVTLPSALPSAGDPPHPPPPATAAEAGEAAAAGPSSDSSQGSSAPAVAEDETIFAFSPQGGAGEDEPAAPAAAWMTGAAASGAPAPQGLAAPKVILDGPSLELLKGSKVDFTKELIGSQFKIVDNPLATSSCGCGTSFDIKV